MWFQVVQWCNEVTKNPGFFYLSFCSPQCGSVVSPHGGKVAAVAQYITSLNRNIQRQVGRDVGLLLSISVREENLSRRH